MTTGDRIKMLRANAGYSRVAFSKKINIPQTTLRNYENDEREPGHNFLIMLAKEFGVSVDYVLGVEKSTSAPLSDNLTKEQREYVEKYFTLNLEGRERVHATINFELAKQRGARKSVTEISAPSNIIDFPQETVKLGEPSMPACAGSGNYLDDNIEWTERTVLKNKYTYGADYIIKLSGDSMEPEFHDGDRLIVTDARGHSPINGRVGIFIINGDAFLRQPLDNRLHPYNPRYKDIVPGEFDDVRYVGYVVGIIDDSWVVG